VAAWFRVQEIDLLHALIITWSFDHYTLRIQQRNAVPVAIRSIPGIRSGSLVGGQQLNCILEDLGVAHKIFFGALDNRETIRETIDYARAAALVRSLHDARIGVVGRRTIGMTPTAVDEVEVLRLFGVRLWTVGLDEFQEMARLVDDSAAVAEWERVSQQATAVSCSYENALASMRNYLALKQLIADRDLQAITVGSYPQCQGTMCLPLALLNDQGVPAGCEGDVNSTIAMFLLSQLSPNPVHFGEMLDVDEVENTVVTSHCGAAAPSLAGEGGYALCPVRLANDGVCIRFRSRPGPVTFVNLVGRKGNYRLCAIEGEAIPTEMVFEGNPMRIRLRTPFRLTWQDIVQHGFGHHWMAAYAHVASPLAEFCQMAGIAGAFPDLGLSLRLF
jgi:L-fucose isomerase-like protein